MSQGPVIASLSAVLLITVAPSSSRSALPAASTLQSDSPARAAVDRGFRSYDAGRYDAARIEFEQALEHAREANDSAAEADARRGTGMVLFKKARYADAHAELLAALRLYETIGDHVGAGRTLHYLGEVAYVHETGAAAGQYWTRGLAEMEAAGDRRGEAQLRYDRATVIPPGPEKAAALQRVLQLAREIGDVQTEGLALFVIGEQQFWDGSYAAALDTFQEALGRLERVGEKRLMAQVLVQVGRLHETHGRPQLASPFYTRAIDIWQRLGDKEGIAQALGAMVNLHRAAGHLRRAAAAGERALALRLEMGGSRVINIERIRLSHVYLALGDHRRAKTLLDDIMRGTDTFTRNLAYDPLAEVYLALGQYEQAREAADLAARTTREPGERPFMLANRAKADEKLGRDSEALADVDEALQIVEHERVRLVPTDSMKQGYGERLQRLFGFAVELRARLGRPEAALEAAEQARARAFLDLLATSRSGSADAKVRSTASRTLDARNDPPVRSAASATPASVDQLAAIARHLDSTIVSYWVGPMTTLVWIVDGEGHVGNASIRVSAQRLASLIGQTSAEIVVAGSPTAKLVADGDTPQVSRGDAMIAAGRTPTHVWRELHDLLVRPVQPFLPRARDRLLTIVPHGPLFRLSFAALLDDRGRYLIERYRLHYVPSGGSLLYLKSRSSDADAPMRYLLVGDPAERASLTKVALPPLPGAAREVAAIARTLPRGTATVLTGARVTEERVRDMVGSHEVLHLATHAVLRDDRPLDSFLALGGRGRDAASDGRLTTADIYGLDLNADLVVLSACQSARGPVTGDGVLGMTRAFMYAGAASIVATLWDVADQSGAELMPAFYRAWRREHSRSAALRAAQLQLLARLRAGTVTIDTPGGPRTLPEHPFFWAGFVLVGEP